MESEETRLHRLVVLLGGIFFILGALFGGYRLLTHYDALGWIMTVSCAGMAGVCLWAWRFGSAKAVKEISRGL